MAIRIQRKRTKGWRMPEGTVYVGRPSGWGNPFAIGVMKILGAEVSENRLVVCPKDAAEAVIAFRWYLEQSEARMARVRELRGKDLACWCPLHQPCHADVLLELANAEEDRWPWAEMTFRPQTVLSLLSELQKVTRERDALQAEAQHYGDSRRSAANFMDMPEPEWPVSIAAYQQYMEYGETCQCECCSHCRIVCGIIERAQAAETSLAEYKKALELASDDAKSMFGDASPNYYINQARALLAKSSV